MDTESVPGIDQPPKSPLEDVIEFYNRGGNRNPSLDPELRPLQLTTGEKLSRAAVLRSLSGSN